MDINESLAFRLGSKDGEARLRSICLALNRKTDSIDIDRVKGQVNMLYMVNYGINRAVKMASVASLFKINAI